MKIQDICIGDSVITEYRLENQILTMILHDKNKNEYEIVITHCSHILVKGSVGFSLSEGMFTSTEALDHWRFYDQDGAVLELKFKGYTMRIIQGSKT